MEKNNDNNKVDFKSEKTKLSDWQMYQIAINWSVMLHTRDLYVIFREKNKFTDKFSDIGASLSLNLSSALVLDNYRYDAYLINNNFCLLHKNTISSEEFNNQYSNLNKHNVYNFKYWLRMRMISQKNMHHILQIIVDYESYFFKQGSSFLSLHFEILETQCDKNTILLDHNRGDLSKHIDKKRIASRYQTLSFYDYSYFYEDKAPDETAVDFWLAMDRYLENPYLTSQNIKDKNPKIWEQYNERAKARVENVANKDRLRNYVHRIMIVTDELLGDDEKKFRVWVRKTKNQKKFVEVYKKTFNRVEKTGLKKIEGDIEKQKGIIGSKLLFCKQKITVATLKNEQEEKYVYSLKFLRDEQWVEYPANKCDKYSKIDVYKPGGEYERTDTRDYKLGNEIEFYEFPNMEYLSYLLHADPKELQKIEKEFVGAFLDRQNSGQYSLGVQIHIEEVKEYVHKNLITKRENWNLENDKEKILGIGDDLPEKTDSFSEAGLSDEDIKIFNILKDNKRIDQFNKNFDKIYNADLVAYLWEKSETEEYQQRNKESDVDLFKDRLEEYDFAGAILKDLKLCNTAEKDGDLYKNYREMLIENAKKKELFRNYLEAAELEILIWMCGIGVLLGMVGWVASGITGIWLAFFILFPIVLGSTIIAPLVAYHRRKTAIEIAVNKAVIENQNKTIGKKTKDNSNEVKDNDLILNSIKQNSHEQKNPMENVGQNPLQTTDNSKLKDVY